MRNLKKFVKQENEWIVIFGQKPLTLSTKVGRKKVAEIISLKLSPENLTCDGELSAGRVRSRYKQLTTLANELQELDPEINIRELA